MKSKITFYTILCMTVTLITSVQWAYGSENGPSPGTPVINVGELNSQKLKEIQSICNRKDGEFIFFAPEGLEIAVRVRVEGSVLSTEESGDTPVTVKFQRPVYFYASSGKGSDPLFSLDGITWSRATELFGGAICFGAGEEKAGETAAPVFDLTLKLDLKSKAPR